MRTVLSLTFLKRDRVTNTYNIHIYIRIYIRHMQNVEISARLRD